MTIAVEGRPSTALGLIAVAVALIVGWAIFHAYVPAWVQALTLAGSTIAAIEAVRVARKAGLP